MRNPDMRFSDAPAARYVSLVLRTYSHMIPQLRNEVADRMDEILSPNRARTPTTSARLQGPLTC
jgi:hypothetical protein